MIGLTFLGGLAFRGGFHMRTIWTVALAALAVAIALTAAHAEPASNIGPGMMPCSDFNQLYKAATLVRELNADPAAPRAVKDLEDYYFSWAQGFMSGINDALEGSISKYRDLRSVSVDQQKQSLRAFCLQNPASKYRDGINFLLNVMIIVPSTQAPAAPVGSARKP
jgi:hypothetical protein